MNDDDEIDDDSHKRDSKGRWLKGVSGSPGGTTRRQQMMIRMLEDLSPKAIRVLEESLSDENPKIRLAAAKEVVGRIAPPPPRPSVAVNVAVGDAASRAAQTQSVIDKAMARLVEAKVQERLAQQNARDAEFVVLDPPKAQTEPATLSARLVEPPVAVEVEKTEDEPQ